MILQTEREHVVETCRGLAASGLVIGTAGNVSVRAGEHVVVSPSATRYDAMTPEDVCVVDLSGALISGARQPTSELQLHLAVYRSRDCAAIVHTHSRAAVAVSTVSTHLSPIHYYLNGLGGQVRVAPYHTYGTVELASAVVSALGDEARAALMSNHGATVLGSTLEEATDRAALLEWMCDVWLLARAAGDPKLLSPTDLAAARDRSARGIYEELSGSRES